MGATCHKEPVIVTVNGKPAFELTPLDEDDDLLDRLLERHPGFRRLLAERLKGPTLPWMSMAWRMCEGRTVTTPNCM